MATVSQSSADRVLATDRLVSIPRDDPVDRWIFVFTAASFIVIVLAGFVPSSLEKIAAVQAGQRPPFPPIMHVHAVLMGTFLALLLAQTSLVATGRLSLHIRLGLASFLLVPAIVVAGFLLAVGNYRAIADLAATAAAPEAREQYRQLLGRFDNILLMQIRVGLLFPLLIGIGLAARRRDPGLHKRMMILATAVPLPAAIDRIPWLPNTFPANPIGPDLYTLLAVAPLLLWDLFRNHRLHRAYVIFFVLFPPVSLLVHLLWGTPTWHAAAREMMGV